MMDIEVTIRAKASVQAYKFAMLNQGFHSLTNSLHITCILSSFSSIHEIVLYLPARLKLSQLYVEIDLKRFRAPTLEA